MPLDPELVRTRCQEITDSVARLQRIGVEPLERFLADADLQDIACYRLQIAIEAALALCYHVAARRLRIVPEDYAACFRALAVHGLLPGDLAERLQRMARLRNLLVHMYWKVDYRMIRDIIQRHLGDLAQFVDLIVDLG
ncbi:MAG: DUF86 domain-containing protein [Thermodesulfobacteriota bacterium]